MVGLKEAAGEINFHVSAIVVCSWAYDVTGGTSATAFLLHWSLSRHFSGRILVELRSRLVLSR